MTLLFISCQKSSPGNSTGAGGGSGSGGNGGQSSGNLVKTITLISYDSASGGRIDSLVIHFGYDGQNRIVSNVQDSYTFNTPSSPGQLSSVDSLTDGYTGTTVAETQQKWENGVHTATIVASYALDASGKMADSSHKTTTNYSGALSTSIPEESVYTYDANGYITRQDNFLLSGGKTISEGGTIFTVSNGNTVQISAVAYLVAGDTATSVRTVIQLGYSSQSANANAVAGDPLNYVGIGSIVLGRPSVDLFQSAIFSELVGGMSIVFLTELFTYGFDSQNRVSTIVYKGPSGNLISKAYYAY